MYVFCILKQALNSSQFLFLDVKEEDKSKDSSGEKTDTKG